MDKTDQSFYLFFFFKSNTSKTLWMRWVCLQSLMKYKSKHITFQCTDLSQVYLLRDAIASEKSNNLLVNNHWIFLEIKPLFSIRPTKEILRFWICQDFFLCDRAQADISKCLEWSKILPILHSYKSCYSEVQRVQIIYSLCIYKSRYEYINE